MKHLLTTLMLMIAPTVMMAKTPNTYPSASASFNIKALDQVFAANPSAVNPNGNCQAVVKLTAEIDGESNCATNNLIYYHVDIDLDSDGTIDMIASSKVNQNFATWTLDTTDQKMKCFMAPNAKGNFSFELPQFIQLNSIKTHKVSWHIYDECGQSSKTSSTFQVKDKKAPTPYCVSINTALMQTNPETVELFAKDYDKGAFDNCSSQNNLAFTFDQLYPVNEHLNEEHYYKKGIDGSIIATHDEFLIGEAYRWIPSMKSCGKIFKCKDFLENNVNMSVWDEAGNTDYCTLRFINFEGCDQWESRINILGKVHSLNNKPIKEATVTFDANLVEYPKSVCTQNGLYSSQHIKGNDYAVSATYPKKDLYNINPKDITRLERHLNGLKPFTHYWQYIAADVNFDKKVDIEDLKHLEKFLPTNESIWLFIQKVDSINTLNWYNYKYYVELKNQQTDVDVDFTAILIGDIDGSSAGLDVIQYDSNNEIKSDENDISYKGQDLSNKGASSFEIIPQDQIFAAHPSPNDPKCMASVQLEAEIKGISNCVSNNLIYYHVEIDLDSDSTVNMIASSYVDKSFTSWTYDEVDKIQKLYVAPDAKGNYIMKLPAFALESKLIRHSVTWKISDECGNVSMQEVTMMSVDKKAPTPYCVSISTVMQSNPYIFEAVAIDYNKGAFDNCTPEDKLIFTFEGIYPLRELINEEHYYKKSGWTSVSATKEEYLKGMAYKWMPDKRSSSTIFTSCGDFNVNISVWDEAENMDYCTVVLRVLCVCIFNSVSIHGKVQSINEKMIREATINIDGNIIEYPKSYQTKNGLYASSHPTILKYFVSADYKAKQTFHVNQKDILRLEAHINGKNPFSHHWQYIAADVNQNKIVDQKDLEFLQNKLLVKDATVWTLIHNVDSLNTFNWYKYDTIVTVDGQNLDAKVDFTAILIGDIDGSSAGLDVVQYDSNDKIESEDNSKSSRCQDFLNKGRFGFNIKANNQVYITNNDCKSLVLLSAEIDGASGCIANSLIYYQIDIDLESDGTIDMIASSDVDQSYNSWTLDPKDNILKCFMAPNAQGDIIFDVPQFSLGYSTNAHKIHWHIFDKCGASSRTISLFYILDKAAPTAICVSPITSYMQSNPMISELWAKDIDNGSFDICSSKEKLIFTFDGVLPIINRRNEPHYFKSGAGGSVNATSTEYVLGKAYRWLPALRSAAKVWTAKGEYKVTLSVFDESGNVGFCNSILKVIGCDMPIELKGKVTNLNFKPLKNAVIRADANYPEFPKERLSSNVGLYNFGNFQCGFHYFLTGNFTLEDKKSVNQKDILRLESHLNGQKPFVYYWQFIAADINQDKEVNNMDLSLLKTQISNNSIPSWNVFQTSKSLNNLTWREYIQNVKIDSTKMGTIEIDFTAVLIGDVNGSHLGVEVDKIDPNDQISNDDETSKRSLYGFNNTDLKAYPNPYADQFTIEFSNTQDEVVNLTLMDIAGKVSHSMELQSFKGKNIFTIQDSFLLTSGIKLIRLESVSGVRHLKVLKTDGHH